MVSTMERGCARRERIGESAGRDAERRCLRFVHLALHAQSSSFSWAAPRVARERAFLLPAAAVQRRAQGKVAVQARRCMG